MRGRADFSWSLYGLGQIIYLLAVASPPSRHRWIFFFPFAFICCYLVFFTSSDNAVNDYGLGCYIFTQFFAAADFILLTEVQKELTLRRGPKKQAIYEAGFSERLSWALGLLTSPRGVGWSHEHPSSLVRHPSPMMSKRHFVMSKCLQIFKNVILYDIAGFINRANPCFHQYGPRLKDSNLIWRVAYVGHPLASIATVDTLHCLYSIVCVVTGMSEPHEFPNLFGSFSEAFSVRRVWGRLWHQTMRRFMTAHADFLGRKFGLSSSEGPMKSAFKSFVAFFISAFIHYSADYMLLHDWSGGSFIFFMLQFAAIMIEEFICFVGKKAGLSKGSLLLRGIGFVWVISWFTFSLPILVEPHIRAGFFEDGLSFSLALGLWRGEWSPNVKTL